MSVNSSFRLCSQGSKGSSNNNGFPTLFSSNQGGKKPSVLKRSLHLFKHHQACSSADKNNQTNNTSTRQQGRMIIREQEETSWRDRRDKNSSGAVRSYSPFELLVSERKMEQGPILVSNQEEHKAKKHIISKGQPEKATSLGNSSSNNNVESPVVVLGKTINKRGQGDSGAAVSRINNFGASSLLNQPVSDVHREQIRDRPINPTNQQTSSSLLKAPRPIRATPFEPLVSQRNLNNGTLNPFSLHDTSWNRNGISIDANISSSAAEGTACCNWKRRCLKAELARCDARKQVLGLMEENRQLKIQMIQQKAERLQSSLNNDDNNKRLLSGLLTSSSSTSPRKRLRQEHQKLRKEIQSDEKHWLQKGQQQQQQQQQAPRGGTPNVENNAKQEVATKAKVTVEPNNESTVDSLMNDLPEENECKELATSEAMGGECQREVASDDMDLEEAGDPQKVETEDSENEVWTSLIDAEQATKETSIGPREASLSLESETGIEMDVSEETNVSLNETEQEVELRNQRADHMGLPQSSEDEQGAPTNEKNESGAITSLSLEGEEQSAAMEQSQDQTELEDSTVLTAHATVLSEGDCSTYSRPPEVEMKEESMGRERSLSMCNAEDDQSNSRLSESLSSDMEEQHHSSASRSRPTGQKRSFINVQRGSARQQANDTSLFQGEDGDQMCVQQEEENKKVNVLIASWESKAHVNSPDVTSASSAPKRKRLSFSNVPVTKDRPLESEHSVGDYKKTAGSPQNEAPDGDNTIHLDMEDFRFTPSPLGGAQPSSQAHRSGQSCSIEVLVVEGNSLTELDVSRITIATASPIVPEPRCPAKHPHGEHGHSNIANRTPPLQKLEPFATAMSQADSSAMNESLKQDGADLSQSNAEVSRSWSFEGSSRRDDTEEDPEKNASRSLHPTDVQTSGTLKKYCNESMDETAEEASKVNAMNSEVRSGDDSKEVAKPSEPSSNSQRKTIDEQQLKPNPKSKSKPAGASMRMTRSRARKKSEPKEASSVSDDNGRSASALMEESCEHENPKQSPENQSTVSNERLNLGGDKIFFHTQEEDDCAQPSEMDPDEDLATEISPRFSLDIGAVAHGSTEASQGSNKRHNLKDVAMQILRDSPVAHAGDENGPAEADAQPRRRTRAQKKKEAQQTAPTTSNGPQPKKTRSSRQKSELSAEDGDPLASSVASNGGKKKRGRRRRGTIISSLQAPALKKTKQSKAKR